MKRKIRFYNAAGFASLSPTERRERPGEGTLASHSMASFPIFSNTASLTHFGDCCLMTQHPEGYELFDFKKTLAGQPAQRRPVGEFFCKCQLGEGRTGHEVGTF